MLFPGIMLPKKTKSEGIRLGGMGLYGGGGTYAPTEAITYTPTEAITEAWQYAPVQTYAPTLQYQIQSPSGKQISKKTIKTVSVPGQEVMPEIMPTVSPEVSGMEKAGGGISTGVVAVAVIGAVAIFVLPKVLKK